MLHNLGWTSLLCINDNNYIVWRGGFRHYPLECQRIHMWYVVKQSDLWSSFLSSPPINTITVSCEISLTFSSPYCKAKCLPACLDVVWVIWRAWTWWCWLCWLDQGIKDCSTAPSVIHRLIKNTKSEMQKHKSISRRIQWWILRTQGLLQDIDTPITNTRQRSYHSKSIKILLFKDDILISMQTYELSTLCLSSSLIKPFWVCESRYLLLHLLWILNILMKMWVV